MKKLIFATGNENKMKEIRMILADCGYEILSMKEAGIQADIVEDGKTFEENAIIKAEAIRKMTNCLVLADDSGLEVDYLDKAPGIYSARFMGEDTSYRIKNKAIIDKLAGVPDEKRTARFVCAIAAAFPDGKTLPDVARLKESLDTKNAARLDLAMILFSSCRSMASPQQSCHRKKRIRSATEDMHFV